MGKFADQLRQFQLRSEGLADNTVRLAVLDVWSRLIIRSPVDSGRFRGAWSVAIDDLVVKEAAPSSDSATVPPPDPPPLSYRLVGRVIEIGNNLPYAQKLEDGHSGQAPSGMVKITALEWPQIVRRAVAAARSSQESTP